MKFTSLAIFICFLFGFSLLAVTDDEIKEQKEGLLFWEKESIAKPKSELDYAYLDNLAAGLRKMPTQRIYSIPEKYKVYELLQESIINFPGYANYFRDQLFKIYDDRLNAPTESREYNRITSNLQLEVSSIYITLKSLPTKETVSALADLYEYSKFDPRPIGDLHQPAESIPMLAGKILNELPIKNRPTPRIDPILSHGSEILNMVEKWRVWCKDVKAGKIEPEFGPEVFRDGSSIPPIAARHQTRPPKPMPTKSQPTVTTSVHAESSSWLWVTGSLAILTGYAVWRMKKVEK